MKDPGNSIKAVTLLVLQHHIKHGKYQTGDSENSRSYQATLISYSVQMLLNFFDPRQVQPPIPNKPIKTAKLIMERRKIRFIQCSHTGRDGDLLPSYTSRGKTEV